MNIAIVSSATEGHAVDVQVLSTALGPLLNQGNHQLRACQVSGLLDAPSNVVVRYLQVDQVFDCVIFLEHVVNHPKLLAAKRLVLVPNPEWLTETDRQLGSRCGHVWHKTRFSLGRLAPLFPSARHDFIGFTSVARDATAVRFDSFLHPRGMVATRRNTATIIEAWRAHPDWPELRITVYTPSGYDFEYPGWLKDGNVAVRLGWMPRDEYTHAFCESGIVLCTSEWEGFGHYINEARSIGCLVMTTDAPPMNELVDADSGILIRAARSEDAGYGRRFMIDRPDLETAVQRVLSLDACARARLAQRAKERFFTEQQAFYLRASQAFERVMDAAPEAR